MISTQHQSEARNRAAMTTLPTRLAPRSKPIGERSKTCISTPRRPLALYCASAHAIQPVPSREGSRLAVWRGLSVPASLFNSAGATAPVRRRLQRLGGRLSGRCPGRPARSDVEAQEPGFQRRLCRGARRFPRQSARAQKTHQHAAGVRTRFLCVHRPIIVRVGAFEDRFDVVEVFVLGQSLVVVGIGGRPILRENATSQLGAISVPSWS